MKYELRLIRATSEIYIISGSQEGSPGFVDFSLYTRRFALWMIITQTTDTLAFTLVESNYLETLATSFVIPVRQNQFLQENFFNSAPIVRFDFAMKLKSALTESYMESPP